MKYNSVAWERFANTALSDFYGGFGEFRGRLSSYETDWNDLQRKLRRNDPHAIEVHALYIKFMVTR